MNRTPARLLLALAASILGAGLAPAQTPLTPAAPAADAAFAAQKSAFVALPPATRKAAQDALVWLGFYNGASDGDFGKRTRDAIVAFELSQKAAGDGVLSAPQLQTLMSGADKARAAVGFRVVTDPKTGARIGAPTKLMGKPSAARLDFASSADADLAALYARLSAETPTRKVAYKAMRPGVFFVVSGQDGATKFYSRFETTLGASPPVRGFTFAYPAAQGAQLDRVAIAIANSFEAFPVQAPASPPLTAPTASGSPPAPIAKAFATALVIGPGTALTALTPADCPNASIGGKPVRFERADPATRLAILAGDFAARGNPPRLGALKPDLIVLSTGSDGVAANSASFAGDAAKPLVIASLEKGASGGPAFDREGGLAGLIAPISDEPKRIAGVALASSHPIIAPEAIGAFLGGGEMTPEPAAPLSAGAIAAREKEAVVAVFCEK
ncbi:MAG: peptidoglycan-binding protein [Hyphomicrobiales bacterium]|nr:peptidoglycan-binding protein [Hyphomicrobiales bacterium]